MLSPRRHNLKPCRRFGGPIFKHLEVGSGGQMHHNHGARQFGRRNVRACWPKRAAEARASRSVLMCAARVTPIGNPMGLHCASCRPLPTASSRGVSKCAPLTPAASSNRFYPLPSGISSHRANLALVLPAKQIPIFLYLLWRSLSRSRSSSSAAAAADFQSNRSSSN